MPRLDRANRRRWWGRELREATARFLDTEQSGMPRRSCLTAVKESSDLRDDRVCWRGVERHVSSVPSDGIFREAVPSRDVAIRQPGPKTFFNFVTLGMQADNAVPRHAITF